MTVKSALNITAGIIGLLLCSLVLLVLLVDANSFKPRIEAMAKQQGIALNMRGDLHWAFWPAIGVAVQDVAIADLDTPQTPIAEVQKASFMVALVPLMKGDLQVKHLLVDGARIHLVVDAQGQGNWAKLLRQPPQADTSPAKAGVADEAADARAHNLKLAIEKVSLHHSQISYSNPAKNQQIDIANINLDMDNVNTQGKPFVVDVALETALGQAAAPIGLKIQLHNSVSLSNDLNALSLSAGKLQLDIAAKAAASLALSYNLKLEDINTSLRYQGDIALPGTNARQLLAAFGQSLPLANEKSLTDVRFSSDFSGDKQQLALERLHLQLDKTAFNGSLALSDFAKPSLKLKLAGDSLNLDDYLPPAAAPGAAAPAAKTPAKLPLGLLAALNVSARLELQELAAKGLHLQQPVLQLTVKNGQLQQALTSKLYAGSLHQQAQLRAQGDTANLQFEAHLLALEVAPLLKDLQLDKSLNLSGAVQLDATGESQASSAAQLVENMRAQAIFSGAKFRLAPLNVEQQFCQMVNLVNRETAPEQQWNAYTELRELSGKINLANRIITVESLTAGVQKLLLNAKGTINLAAGSYDFLLPLKIQRDANDSPTSITTSAQGCKVTSNYWAERGMSLLRCKGAYANIDPKSDCRPDKDQLNEVIKDFAEYKLKGKAEAKKTELLKKLDDKLGGGAKDLFKNLFKKKDGQ